MIRNKYVIEPHEVVSNDDKNYKIEFSPIETNKIDPVYDVIELGLNISDGENFDLDVSFDEKQFDSLIDYLKRLRKYAKKFNSENKEKAKEQEHGTDRTRKTCIGTTQH